MKRILWTVEAHFLQNLEETTIYLCHTDKEKKSVTVTHKTNDQVDRHVKNTEYSAKQKI